MSRKILEKHRRRYAAESGENTPGPGPVRIALIYPNGYSQAMANLGYQTVYHLFNASSDCCCERFFLPDKEDLVEYEKNRFPLVSLETGTPLAEFDLIALSISFENDYLNLPKIFELGHIPLFSAQRGAHDPLVLFGGVCAFLNPEPLAEIADLVAVGEAEVILPVLIPALLTYLGHESTALGVFEQLPGIYLPAQVAVGYLGDGTLAKISAPGVLRQYLADLDTSASRSFILNEEAEFGSMALTEVMRGCSRGCRFCAAGYVYLPPRERSLENLIPQVEAGLCHRSRIGLVGAAVADHADISALQQEIMLHGGEVSVSSLRLDALTSAEARQLQAAGLKTVAIAPEAGSQQMRDLINKNLDEAQILHAVHLLADAGMLNLKLYFLIGLPGEEDSDIDAILALADQVRLIWREAGRKRGSLGNLTLSVNPFIPKPFTPFQWAGMETEKGLKQKLRKLHVGVSKLPNTELISESIRSSQLQALFARGDRRIGRLLPEIAAGGNLGQILRRNGLQLDFYVTRERGEFEIFPWEVIDQGNQRSYLWQEYQKGLSGKATPRCFDGCRRCGIC
ncbi:radical SAM protein [Geopsychrobacter electrodiphilus]|uniref:radical SAM protein n=1 Tax=Geopsychrobacter electrodiphilus TaxID=225196 RepID=UPI0003756796|nr:radical SAM protein [Geopsychrobacter electrodiphilus]